MQLDEGWVLILAAGGAGFVLWMIAHAIEKALELVNEIGGFEP